MIGVDVANKVFTGLEVLDRLIDQKGDRLIVVGAYIEGEVSIIETVLEVDLLNLIRGIDAGISYSSNCNLDMNKFYIENGGHYDVVFDTLLQKFYSFKKSIDGCLFERTAPDTDLKIRLMLHEGRTYFDKHSKHGSYYESTDKQSIPIKFVDFDFYYILNSRIFFFRKNFKSHTIEVVGSIYEMDGYFHSVFKE